MSTPRLHVLCIGHADSPQFARRCALLRQAGLQVTELTGSERPVTPGAACLTPRGLPLGRFWRLLTLSRMVDFFSLLRRAKPDLVLAQYAQGLWSWLAPLAGRPMAVCAMGGDVLLDEQGAPSAPERRATQGLLRLAGLVLCSSAHLAQSVRALRPAGQVLAFPWGPDETVFHPGDKLQARRELSLPPEAWVVFSPRAMQPLYRVAEIVEAFALACADRPQARLLLGTFRADADYLSLVRKRCAEPDLVQRVIFLPPQDAQGMARCYHAADVCVSFPNSDGLPQSFFEASACGAPMLLSDLPNYNQSIRHEEHALLAAPGPQALACALRRAQADPALCRQLTQNAQLLLGERGSSALAQQLGELLARCAASPPPGRLRALPQLFHVLAALALGRPIAARSGQPTRPLCLPLRPGPPHNTGP